MNDKLNSINLRRKSKVGFVPDNGKPSAGIVGAFLENVAGCGYILSPELVSALQISSDEIITVFHNWLIPELKKNLGEVKSAPMYPNFPAQVAVASNEELWVNAILQYLGDWFGTRIMPKYEVLQREPLLERICKLKPIGLLTFETDTVLDDLLSMKASPSEQDKEDLKTLLALSFTCNVVEVPNKEVLSFAFSESLSVRNETISNHLRSFVKTPVDILRIAVALSGGDVSLSEDSKFISFNRSTRKLLLEMFEKLNEFEDMMRFREKFKRLGEGLHPGEFAKRYPKTFKAFDAIRHKGLETFNSKVEKAILTKEFNELLELVGKRPGDFARRLDHILRMTPEKDRVLEEFSKVSSKVSTPVLWQLYSFFKNRESIAALKERAFFPKGRVAKILTAPNKLGQIERSLEMAFASEIYKAILENYFDKPKLGTVYLDPMLQKLVIPTGNRSMQAALRQVGRGSRFTFDPETKTLRLFMYWKDLPSRDRVDLDIGVVNFDKDWNYRGHVSYTRLRDDRAIILHSGDITSAPEGASEYIDINLDKLERGSAYIAFQVTSFTGQQFSELSEGFVGWMSRSKPGSGEIYEPKTVENRIDLRSQAVVLVPIVVDIANKEIIYEDITISSKGRQNNIESMSENMLSIGAAIVSLPLFKASLYDLFEAHVLARGGKLVETREEAEFSVVENGTVSPFDVAKICAEYL